MLDKDRELERLAEALTAYLKRTGVPEDEINLSYRAGAVLAKVDRRHGELRCQMEFGRPVVSMRQGPAMPWRYLTSGRGEALPQGVG